MLNLITLKLNHMKKIIVLISSFLLVFNMNASHISEGEIWYEHISGNSYELHLRLYRDCQGIGLGTSQTISISSINGAVTNSASLSQTSAQMLYSCNITTCTNPSSSTKGFMVHEYSGTVNLPSSQTDWIFSFSTCCRVPSLNLSGGQGTYVYASLDNSSIPFNNSVVSPYALSLYYPINVASSISFAGTEIDGDSLDFRLVPVRTGNGNNANYILPYSATTPFTNSSLSLNSQTGVMSFTPTMVGTAFIGVEIREFRNGNLISSLIRDYQLQFIGATVSNSVPDVSGVNNTIAFTANVNSCGNSSMNFTINSTDADAADSTILLGLALPAGANFTTSVAQNEIGTFSWAVTQADVRAQPYLLVVEVRDNNCGVSQEVYQLYVNNCNTDSVWAGDANADFTCDNFDVLNVGIANNTSGALRPAATSMWQAEWCPNWTNNFISNINYKHADCNGDGTVNSSDLAAITANYGLVHQKNNQIGQYKTLGLPDLYCDVANVQANKGSTLTLPIMLGTPGSEINNFYGISATVELLNAQTSAPISVTKNVSWIGNATNSFEFEKSLAATKTAFTFVRNNQQNLMSQQGQIGEITFPIDANSATGSKVIIQFSDIKMIQKNGEEITDYNVMADTMEILAPSSVNDYENRFAASVYPNPNQGQFMLSLQVEKAAIFTMALYDAAGRKVGEDLVQKTLSQGKHHLDLNINDKALGHYFLEIKTEEGKKMIPIQKW